MRRTHLLARRRQADARAPREPLGAALERPLFPAEAIVELAHEHEHAIRIGVHLPHEAADRGIELVDTAVLGRGVGIGSMTGPDGAHGGPPCECYWIADHTSSS